MIVSQAWLTVSTLCKPSAWRSIALSRLSSDPALSSLDISGRCTSEQGFDFYSKSRLRGWGIMMSYPSFEKDHHGDGRPIVP